MNKKRYYVCSPLKAPTRKGVRRNMCDARAYMEVVERLTGGTAFAPHAFLPAYLDDGVEDERRLGMEFGINFIMLCDGLVVCGERISEGMGEEIRKAREAGVSVLELSMERPIRRYYHMVDACGRRMKTLATDGMKIHAPRIDGDVERERITLGRGDEDDKVRGGKEAVLQPGQRLLGREASDEGGGSGRGCGRRKGRLEAV